MSGPLSGIRVVEMEGIGPVPWAGMMLSGMGAKVIRIERPQAPELGIKGQPKFELATYGKEPVPADLKTDSGRETVLAQLEQADILIEGQRPGVMERLGLSPEDCWSRNRALVYGRMTGWGQTGPLAQSVGHDINYIGLSGALHAIGDRNSAPAVPLNLIGDFGAGGMLLIAGVLAALHEARTTGQGRVVDAAMVDGTLAMMAPIFGRWQSGHWEDQREANWLDGGAPFYTTYQTSDGKAMAVGAIESRFYAALLKGLELDPAQLPAQNDKSRWPEMKARFAAIFAAQSRDFWTQRFEGTEACVTPILSLAELETHPHFIARNNFVERDGVRFPAPAPRFG